MKASTLKSLLDQICLEDFDVDVFVLDNNTGSKLKVLDIDIKGQWIEVDDSSAIIITED